MRPRIPRDDCPSALAVRQVARDRRTRGEAFMPGAQSGQRREIGQGCSGEISVARPCGGGRSSTHATSLGHPLAARDKTMYRK